MGRIVAEVIREDDLRRNFTSGQVSFLRVAATGWTPEPSKSSEPPADFGYAETDSSRRGQRSWEDRIATAGARGSWKCPECGHVNKKEVDYCENCESGDEEVLTEVRVAPK